MAGWSLQSADGKAQAQTRRTAYLAYDCDIAYSRPVSQAGAFPGLFQKVMSMSVLMLMLMFTSCRRLDR